MKKLPVVAFVLLVMAAFPLVSIGQKADYKPGEKIEYRSSGYPEVWEEATFVRHSQDGSQPIIRQKPDQFNKDGFQRATSWSEIRRPGHATRIEPAPPVKTGGAETMALPARFTGGLMTQAEVIAFLQTNMGENPYQNPRREAIKRELAEMIMQRGLDFRYSTSLTDLNKQLNKYGANTSDVSFPLGYNFGPPTPQSWLLGTWKLGKIGAAVDYTKNNRIYTQGEIAVANVGTLTINANGTFNWRASTAATSTTGKWREATPAEMRHVGGAGIVLLKAKTGYDWIVTKNRKTTLAGEWLDISEINTRQINEYGQRGGKK